MPVADACLYVCLALLVCVYVCLAVYMPLHLFACVHDCFSTFLLPLSSPIAIIYIYICPLSKYAAKRLFTSSVGHRLILVSQSHVTFLTPPLGCVLNTLIRVRVRVTVNCTCLDNSMVLFICVAHGLSLFPCSVSFFYLSPTCGIWSTTSGVARAPSARRTMSRSSSSCAGLLRQSSRPGTASC